MKKENSLIYEMLRTPQQVQQEQLEKIRERSLKTMQARQANLSDDPIIGALQSGFADAGARAARILPEQRAAYGKAVGGLLSAASGLGVDPNNVNEQDKKRMSMLQNIGRDIERSQLTPEAQEAAKTQDLVKGVDTKTPEGLEAAATKLENVRPDIAEAFRDKARQLRESSRKAGLEERQMANDEFAAKTARMQAESYSRQVSAQEGDKPTREQQITSKPPVVVFNPETGEQMTAYRFEGQFYAEGGENPLQPLPGFVSKDLYVEPSETTRELGLKDELVEDFNVEVKNDPALQKIINNIRFEAGKYSWWDNQINKIPILNLGRKDLDPRSTADVKEVLYRRARDIIKSDKKISLKEALRKAAKKMEKEAFTDANNLDRYKERKGVDTSSDTFQDVELAGE